MGCINQTLGNYNYSESGAPRTDYTAGPGVAQRFYIGTNKCVPRVVIRGWGYGGTLYIEFRQDTSDPTAGGDGMVPLNHPGNPVGRVGAINSISVSSGGENTYDITLGTPVTFSSAGYYHMVLYASGSVLATAKQDVLTDENIHASTTITGTNSGWFDQRDVLYFGIYAGDICNLPMCSGFTIGT